MDEGSARAHDQPVTALQRLIRDQKDEQDLSYGRIEQRAGKKADGTPRLSRSYVQKLVRSPLKKSPGDDTVRGLAAGLGVPLSTVKDAISESLNLRTITDDSDPTLRVFIDQVEDLDPVSRQRYLRMARALLEEFKK